MEGDGDWGPKGRVQKDLIYEILKKCVMFLYRQILGHCAASSIIGGGGGGGCEYSYLRVLHY
jgi:hypothetical protein